MTQVLTQRTRREAWGVAVLILILSLTYGLLSSNNLAPSANVLVSDFGNYSIAVLQTEYPDLFINDPIWGNGELTNSLWVSSGLYMRLNQIFYSINGESFASTRLILHTLTFSLIFYGLYWLLTHVAPNPHPIFAIMMASSVTFSVMFRSGISYLPTGFYYAFTSFVMIGVYLWLILPGLEGRKTPLLRLFIMGIVIGLSPALVSSVNGLAFILWLGVISGIQMLLRQMTITTFMTFWAGVIPAFLVSFLLGAGGANAISTESAQFLVGTIRAPRFETLLGFTALLVIMSIFGAIAWLRQHLWAKVCFSLTHMILWVIYGILNSRGHLVDFYLLAILFVIFVIYRVLRKQDTKLEYAFMIGITATLISGPYLQRILYIIWETFEWNQLVGVMWQMYRFPDVVFLPLAMALFFMLSILTQPIPEMWQRMSIWAAFLWALPTASRYVREMWGEVFTAGFYSLLILILAVILAFILSHPSLTKHFAVSNGLLSRQKMVIRVIFAGAMFLIVLFFTPNWITVPLAGLSLIVLIWFSARSLQAYMLAAVFSVVLLISVVETFDALRAPAQNDVDYAQEMSWVDTLVWIRVNTPEDALIHANRYYNESIRVNARRSLLTSWMDQLNTPYANLEAIDLAMIREDSIASETPSEIVGFSARYNVDYLVVDADFPPPQPARYNGIEYTAQVVYQNNFYVIYHINVPELVSHR